MKRFFFYLFSVLFVVCLISAQQTPIVKTATATLTVGAAPSFTLAVTPANINTYVGRTVAYTATVTSVNGFAGDVTLAVTGLPTNVVIEILPSAKLTLGTAAPASWQVNVTLPNDPTLIKTHTITFTATSIIYN